MQHQTLNQRVWDDRPVHQRCLGTRLTTQSNLPMETSFVVLVVFVVFVRAHLIAVTSCHRAARRFVSATASTELGQLVRVCARDDDQAAASR